jgi:hypothetical protein
MKKVLIFLILVIMMSCKNVKVKFEFVRKINIVNKFEYSSRLINNKKQLTHIFNQKNKPLYDLRNYIDYNDYNFENYDYIITFGKKLVKIKLSEDDCNYLSKIPIETLFGEESLDNNLYIYKLQNKNKYRNLCP